MDKDQKFGHYYLRFAQNLFINRFHQPLALGKWAWVDIIKVNSMKLCVSASVYTAAIIMWLIQEGCEVTLLQIWRAVVIHTVATVRPYYAHFVTCKLYLLGKWLRFALKFMMQNGREFREVILLYHCYWYTICVPVHHAVGKQNICKQAADLQYYLQH